MNFFLLLRKYKRKTTIIITNIILDVKLPFNVAEGANLDLYDKLASSCAGINAFIRYLIFFNEQEKDLFFTSILKLRYTHSIWFDEGLRKLDNYKQEFFTANLSVGIGFNFGE